MRNPTRILILVLLLAFAAGPASLGAAAPAGGARPVSKIAKRPVTFKVKNVNRTDVACASDGLAYEIKGHLIGPASRVGPAASVQPGAVTLYLHSASFGEFFWTFGAVPGYDYAGAQARAGSASVVVDRLGYGSSSHPDGNQVCIGADADIAHQIVGQLRAGDYVVDSGDAPRFERVALAGHGVGGLIANIEALTFKDVDGLVTMGYTSNVTRRAFEQFYATRAACLAGGEQLAAGGPGAYTFFGRSPAEFEARAFFSVDRVVREAVSRLRAPDPCGESDSIVPGLLLDVRSLSLIRAPVLVVCGREDETTPSFTCPYLKRRYTGSRDVSLYFIPKAGHALTLERRAPNFRRRVADWLRRHGL
jgi:pimeloyl-ACP methyl ester carboxylesterase